MSWAVEDQPTNQDSTKTATQTETTTESPTETVTLGTTVALSGDSLTDTPPDTPTEKTSLDGKQLTVLRDDNQQVEEKKKEEVYIIDPSELFRPEYKSENEYRIYTTDQDTYIQRRVFRTYKKMHTYQTMEFAQKRLAQWTRFNLTKLTILEALEQLNCLVDESDPDVDLPNIVHAFQTAERIRIAHPDLDWFHLTGLVHDLGKLLALYGEPQWAVVGDTFPLGCQFADSIVYRKETFGKNPDLYDARYNTKYGVYEPNCGLKKVVMSWGHDEYMYQVMKAHKGCKLPEEALYIIRFHSFYPWHTGGDYYHLCNEHDLKMLPWVREFNKFDLYSKSPDVPDVKALVPYYRTLIDKYIPGVVNW